MYQGLRNILSQGPFFEKVLFYYCEDFNQFTGSQSKYEDPRIVIPLVRNNVLIGLQGRSLDRNPIKYLTIMFDEDAPKVYGLDTIDKESFPSISSKDPLTAFLPNSVAMCGSDGEIRDLEGSDKVYVYDNEPRNKEIVSRIGRVIERGGKVVIWPSNVREKDLNDMVLAGHKVPELVKSNVYSGLEAKLKFTTWKKI